MVAIRWVCLAAVSFVMAAAAGCTPAASYQKLLQSATPLDRVHGCAQAADSGDKAAVGLLVDRLEDSDEAVRFAAHQSLRKLTDKDFGYRESDPPANRAAAVARWRQYAATRRAAGGP
jgi:hypothetical protein